MSPHLVCVTIQYNVRDSASHIVQYQYSFIVWVSQTDGYRLFRSFITQVFAVQHETTTCQKHTTIIMF